MKEYKIAIIGSRETPGDVMQEMLDTLREGFRILRKKGYTITTRSGGCYKGPDQLQFMLARTEDVKSICYLPDEKKMWLGKIHPKVEFRYIPQDVQYRAIVASLHPNPDKLSPIAWALHGRNLNIIAGDRLDEPVDVVYYFSDHDKHGNAKGGTAMGVKYAKSIDVPCYYHTADRDKWLESLRLL